MNFWSVFEAVCEIFCWVRGWRFNVCLFAGVCLGLFAAAHIPAQPLNWIAAGVIVAIAIYIGWRWDDSH
jgi:uncharacterized membrane protein YfcA